jgi:hypothetical protein
VSRRDNDWAPSWGRFIQTTAKRIYLIPILILSFRNACCLLGCQTKTLYTFLHSRLTVPVGCSLSLSLVCYSVVQLYRLYPGSEVTGTVPTVEWRPQFLNPWATRCPPTCSVQPAYIFSPWRWSGSRPKRGCLLTLAYYAFPRWYEFGERRWNDIDRGKPKKSEKTCPSATLSATNPTWIDPGPNPGLRGERPATNDLNHGTASVHL